MHASQSSATGMSIVRREPDAHLLAHLPKPVTVWGQDGERLGYARSLVLGRADGQIQCLLVGRGRVVRRGARMKAIPWGLVRYDERLRAYMVLTTAFIYEDAPIWTEVGGVRASLWRAHTYFGVRPRA